MKYIKQVKHELCAAGIAYRINSEGLLEYLIAKRFKDEKAHLIRGRVEPHQYPEETVIDEFRDEVSIDVLVIPHIEFRIRKRINEKTKKEIKYYLMWSNGQNPKPDKDEIESAWWATLKVAALQLGNRYEVDLLKQAQPLIYRYLRDTGQNLKLNSRP